MIKKMYRPILKCFTHISENYFRSVAKVECLVLYIQDRQSILTRGCLGSYVSRQRKRTNNGEMNCSFWLLLLHQRNKSRTSSLSVKGRGYDGQVKKQILLESGGGGCFTRESQKIHSPIMRNCGDKFHLDKSERSTFQLQKLKHRH